MEAQFDIHKTTAVVCEECKNPTFRPVVFLRKISRFVSPDAQDHVVPMDSMECAKCGHINKDFNPSPEVHLEEKSEDSPILKPGE